MSSNNKYKVENKKDSIIYKKEVKSQLLGLYYLIS